MTTNVVRFPAERRNPTMSNLEDLVTARFMFADIEMIAEDLDLELPTDAEFREIERSIYEELSGGLPSGDRESLWRHLRPLIQPRIDAAIRACREVECLATKEAVQDRLAMEAVRRGSGEDFFRRLSAIARGNRIGAEIKAYGLYMEARAAHRAAGLLAEGKPWAPENQAETRAWFETFLVAS